MPNNQSASQTLHLLPSKLRKLQRKYADITLCPRCRTVFKNERGCPACDWTHHEDRLPLRPLSLQEIMMHQKQKKKYSHLDRQGIIHYGESEEDIGAEFASCAHPLSDTPDKDIAPNSITYDPRKVTCPECLKIIEGDQELIKRLIANGGKEKHGLDLDFLENKHTLLCEIPVWVRNKYTEENLSAACAFEAVVLEQSLAKIRYESIELASKLPALSPKSDVIEIQYNMAVSDWWMTKTAKVDLNNYWGYDLHYMGSGDWHATFKGKNGVEDFSITFADLHSLIKLLNHPRAVLRKVQNYHSCSDFLKEFSTLISRAKVEKHVTA